MSIKNNISIWNSKIEKILIEQKNKCGAYKWMHELECDHLSKINKTMNITNIAIVSISATASIITNDLEFKGHFAINIIYPIMLYITTVISSLQHFLNYEKLSEKHRTASIRYTALYNNIKRVLSLDENQRQEANTYFEWVNKEYDNIFSSSPDISQTTILKFENTFKTNISFVLSDVEADAHVCVNDNNFIMQIEKDSSSDSSVEIKKQEIHAEQQRIQTETEKLKYELDRFIVHSYNC